jgi:predicted metal-binding membrane protein
VRDPAASLAGRDHQVLLILVAVVSGLAWFALWHWGQSPYVHYVHHTHLHVPPASGVTLALVFLAGWTLMTVAMMLPTSVPLLGIFSRVARSRSDRPLLVALVVVGYLLVWTAVGAGTYIGALAVRSMSASSPWLSANGWILGAGTLFLGGAYQFSALKYRCLDKCRSPFLFVMQHWSGTHHARQAFRLGLRHGLFCVGCCWALMLLMLPFGAASLGWMLALGILMAVEKNVSWGRRLGRPMGALLLLLGLAVALRLDAGLW